MDLFLAFIQSNCETIIIGAILIIALAIFIYRRRTDLLAKGALYFVTKAQEAWGSDMGRVKFAEVYASLRKQYPFITFFMSEKQLSDVIEKALEELKAIVSAKAEKEMGKGVEFEDMDYVTQTILLQTGKVE